MVHKSIVFNGAMSILDATAAADNAWDKLKNLPAWDFRKVKSIAEVVQHAKKDGILFHFASLMDLRHLKHSELAKPIRKYEGAVVLRGEQGASASHVAARFLDTISRHCGMGEASDAVSACTQVHMSEAPG